MKKVFYIILAVSLLLNVAFLAIPEYFQRPIGKFIIINKGNQKLSVHSEYGTIIEEFDVSTGSNAGNKIRSGDSKTPEGVFSLINIEDALSWKYDFDDGAGPVSGAYGPFFLRLNVNKDRIFKNVSDPFVFSQDDKFKGIGIHGTHDNSQIGHRASHGCIRLKNKDLLVLKEHVFLGMQVIILPGYNDYLENGL